MKFGKSRNIDININKSSKYDVRRKKDIRKNAEVVAVRGLLSEFSKSFIKRENRVPWQLNELLQS